MSRTLVLGDVHGAARALEQVFERAGFDPATDRLISLGDICDRWPEVDRCIDLLLDVQDFTLVLGNHDEWTLAWMLDRGWPVGWLDVGGDTTIESYARRAGVEMPRTAKEATTLTRHVPDSHAAFLGDTVPYLIAERDDAAPRLFTHAGWDPTKAPEDQTRHDLRMGRELWTRAQIVEHGLETDAPETLTEFSEVYLGHTPTDWIQPRPVLEIWNLDQGAGWDGVLTLMDVDTKEVWQSDRVPALYG